jgi:hypothetical protein
MSRQTSKDWADGISLPLRQLVSEGADDEELQRFILAVKSGSSKDADRILNAPRTPRAPRADANLSAETDQLVRRVSTAALRPVVNSIDVRLLLSYMETVRYLARHVVVALEHEPFWSSERAVGAVGDVIAKYSLEHIDRQAS